MTMGETSAGGNSATESLVARLATVVTAIKAAETALQERQPVDLEHLHRQIADICRILTTTERRKAQAHLQAAESILCALDRLEAAVQFGFTSIGSADDQTASKAEHARRAYAGVMIPATRPPPRER